MARDSLTVKLSTTVNRPLAYVGLALRMAGEWLLRKSVKVRIHGA